LYGVPPHWFDERPSKYHGRLVRRSERRTSPAHDPSLRPQAHNRPGTSFAIMIH
jgi:hypothetical protein